MCISWQVKGGRGKEFKSAALYRSTTNLQGKELDLTKYPVTKIELPGKTASSGTIRDMHAAFGTEYFYVLELLENNGSTTYSAVTRMSNPSKQLHNSSEPTMEIDKINYVLTLKEGAATINRYPIALGKKPSARKLFEDCATTPEGIYEIVNEPDPA